MSVVDLHPTGEASSDGAAKLLHLLLSQGLDRNPERQRVVERLAVPVTVTLRDAGGTCSMVADGSRLAIWSGDRSGRGVRVEGLSRHLVDVTQLRMPSALVPLGLVAQARGRGLVRDLLLRRLRIRGLLRHYATASRFLYLINIED